MPYCLLLDFLKVVMTDFTAFEKLFVTVIVSCFFIPEVDLNTLSIDNGTAESCYTKQR